MQKQQKNVSLIQYTNKRGKVVKVWPWTLNKRTTIFQANEGSADTAKFVRESSKTPKN